MGFPWKAVVNAVLHIAEPLVPGAAEADAAIHAAIDAKTGTERERAIIDAALAGLATAETFKPELIPNPALFHEGVIEAHEAADKIRRALQPAA